MRIKLLLLAIILLLNTGAVKAERETKSFYTIARETKNGVRYHKRKDYEKAYQYLSVSAQWGIKEAQYLLGIMFLNGEYVDRSIDKGMAWLGVANEIEIKDWKSAYDEIYNQLNDAQQKYIDVKVLQYIEYYGMGSQHLDCRRTAYVGSRKASVLCEKIPYKFSKLYPIER